LQNFFWWAKVEVLRESHQLWVTPYRQFEAKKAVNGPSQKSHLKYEVYLDFSHHIRRFLFQALVPSVSDRGAHEEM
jgi:hypothetical protein